MALTEPNHALEFLLSEAAGARSREEGTLNAGQNCVAGTVLGQLLTATATNVTAGAGEGDGAITVGAIGANIEIGTYVLTCTAESAGAGTFSVRTPSGLFLPDLTVAVAYASTHINLTVADGAEDWNTGNIIHVEVTAGDYEALDPAEDDGAQIAAAVLAASVDATSADQTCVVLKRDCECASARLTWPSGITDAQKATATAQLASKGLLIRS